VSIGFFHLEMPRAHYFFTGCAISCGCGSMALYLLAVDCGALVQPGDPAFISWSLRVQRWVRPSVKAVLALHLVAVGVGAWKALSLTDDVRALAFGIVETTVIIGDQVFQGAMVVDDLMLDHELRSPAPAGIDKQRCSGPTQISADAWARVATKAPSKRSSGVRQRKPVDSPRVRDTLLGS
jgi:hypothetical protein